MRFTTPLALVAALLLVVGCGGDADNAFEFKSKTSKPTGDAVKITYAMEKGEGIRMNMTMRGTMKATGAQDMTMPMDSEFVMTLQCADVLENGDRVVEMAIESMKMAVAGEAGLPDDMFGEFKGRMTIDKNGKMKDMDYSGADPEIGAQLDQIFKSPGFQSFVPMPPEGMRVGEALDLAEIMPMGAMEQLMSAAMPGSTIKPELNGELVLVGTREVAGEQVAEFAMNLVMNMSGSMSQMGKTIDMDFGIKITGTQFSSLRTGFPLGTSEMEMKMRGNMEADGEEIEMNMDMAITIDCSKL